MKPPTRQRAPRKQFDTGFNRKWTLKEKENLVQGIKRSVNMVDIDPLISVFLL